MNSNPLSKYIAAINASTASAINETLSLPPVNSSPLLILKRYPKLRDFPISCNEFSQTIKLRIFVNSPSLLSL